MGVNSEHGKSVKCIAKILWPGARHSSMAKGAVGFRRRVARLLMGGLSTTLPDSKKRVVASLKQENGKEISATQPQGRKVHYE